MRQHSLSCIVTKLACTVANHEKPRNSANFRIAMRVSAELTCDN